MIRHIVFFRCRDRADYDTVYDGLSLLAEIPDCQKFEVGRNLRADTIGSEAPDFVVYSEFKDEAQLEAYKQHPVYEKAISIVRPLRDMRIAADFVSEDCPQLV